MSNTQSIQVMNLWVILDLFNIKILSYQYMKSLYGEKMIFKDIISTIELNCGMVGALISQCVKGYSLVGPKLIFS